MENSKIIIIIHKPNVWSSVSLLTVQTKFSPTFLLMAIPVKTDSKTPLWSPPFLEDILFLQEYSDQGTMSD